MRSPRPSRITTGSLIHSTSNLMVDQTTSDALPLTQDGGRCSDSRVLMLLTREERFLKLLEVLTRKIEILESTIETIKSINNGISSMLINGKENQPRVNSTIDSVFMLKETSMLYQLSQIIDTSILSTTETW
jgi:hypothetical protein